MLFFGSPFFSGEWFLLCVLGCCTLLGDAASGSIGASNRSVCGPNLTEQCHNGSEALAGHCQIFSRPLSDFANDAGDVSRGNHVCTVRK